LIQGHKKCRRPTVCIHDNRQLVIVKLRSAGLLWDRRIMLYYRAVPNHWIDHLALPADVLFSGTFYPHKGTTTGNLDRLPVTASIVNRRRSGQESGARESGIGAAHE
jgi:hypothetical protein